MLNNNLVTENLPFFKADCCSKEKPFEWFVNTKMRACGTLILWAFFRKNLLKFLLINILQNQFKEKRSQSF